jgi:2-C-methyl-D-erythritol 4-phosphate cytidylyltransferase
MPRIASILLAGGSGSRFSSGQDKLQVLLHDQPVIHYSAQAAFNHPWVNQCVVVCPADRQVVYWPLIKTACLLPPQWALAGDTRQASVWAALQQLKPDIDWVLIHDAARPLACPDQVNAFVAQFNGRGGSAFAHPVVDTLKQRQPDGQWLTLPRDTLWATETPQLFDKATLVQAYKTIKAAVTDDLQLLELAGLGPVQLWHHSQPNHKITHLKDVPLLQQFINPNH